MGRQYHARGQITAAEKCYRQVLTLDANNIDALHLLGVIALQTNHFEDALKLIGRAAQTKPRDPSIYVNLGLVYRRLGNDDKAIEMYQKALSINPDFWDALYNLGKLFLDTLRFKEAVGLYERCVALNPSDADGHANLGSAYKFTGESDKAMAAYERALRLSPNLAHVYGNIAAILLDRGWHNASLAVMDKAITLAPQPGELRFKRALLLLRHAQFEVGWSDYESRFFSETERIARWPEPPSYWEGEDLSGKTIVVRSEQGLGDEILYTSMVPEVIARAGRCIMECSPRMVPVFKRSFPTIEVRAYKFENASGARPEPADYQGVDYQIAVGSLGRFLRQSLDQFPRHQGFLQADKVRSAQLRARYQAIKPGNKIVGISWRSKNDRIGNSKSARLAEWTDILTVPGVTFVNLQYGDCAEDIAAVQEKYGIEIFQDADVNPMASMDDCFAQVAAMDLVISTSNTTVHVAGSLNIPAWVMLVTGPGSLWYWFLERSDSPWYPALQLFRQPPGGDAPWWHDAVQRIGKKLAAWAK